MKTLLSVAMMLCGLSAVVNSAFAQTLTQTTAPFETWSCVSSSADGTILFATAFASQIYSSTNSGATWITNNVPSGSWISVASSADGTKIVAANANYYTGQIFTSTNTGATWISNNVPTVLWTSVSSSADGTKLIALAMTNLVYTSTNSGTTWTSNSLPTNIAQWLLSASSADGAKLVIVGDAGAVYRSINSGASWNAVTNLPLASWQAVASSADGNKLAIVGVTNAIYTSSDGGSTWNSNSVFGITTWSDIASSADGSRLFATPYSFQNSVHGLTGHYFSTNSGATWTQDTNALGSLYGIVSSADGNKLVLFGGDFYGGIFPITILGGVIFTSFSTPLPQLNIGLATDNFALSWTIPSTNFVLQQSPDLISWSSITDAPTLNLT